jgi:hypothetical protein
MAVWCFSTPRSTVRWTMDSAAARSRSRVVRTGGNPLPKGARSTLGIARGVTPMEAHGGPPSSRWTEAPMKPTSVTTASADGSRETRALALGAEVAAAIVALREDDGTDVDLESPGYTPGTRPGDYQFVPPYNFAFAVDFAHATPFGLESPGQLRVPPPPALTSRRYAKDYKEVKSFGRRDSTTRTPNQSNYANWWYEGSEIGWTRIARVTTTSEELELWQAARMFALVNMALYDSYIAGWDSKIHYDRWRPYTAIRAGDTDGNPTTIKDATWESYLETPPIQDYPSTHSVLAAGAAEVLRRCFGTDHVPFSMGSLTALPANPVRSFTTFTRAADENAASRVMAGIHFRFATEQGQALGRKVGSYIVKHHLQRR